MNKEELKQYIDDNIYENVDGDISGDSLNEVLKAIVDDGGTEVEANPEDPQPSSEILLSLRIDGVDYAIPENGSNVVANPTGDATQTLNKIEIDNIIYTAPQGPQGEQGPAGPQGEPGEDGQDGQPGAPGPANTLSIGTVTGGDTASAQITGTAPNQTLNLTLPRGQQGVPGQAGADAVNPFKGWFNSLAELKAAHTATDGDSAYVKDASPATTWSIYVYDSTASSDNYWADSGTDADTSNVQTFASGEEVNETYIDNTHLVNPKSGALPTAEDVLQLKAKLEGVTASETKVQLVTSGEGQNIYDGGYVNGITGGYESSGANKIVIVPVSGVKKVRFLGGVIPTSSAVNVGYSFGVLTSEDKPNSTLSNFTPLIFSTFDKYGTERIKKEYSLSVPNDVTWLCITYWTNPVEGFFYCYTLNGDTAIIDADIDRHYNKVLRIESSQFAVGYYSENLIINETTGKWSIGSNPNVTLKHLKINIENVFAIKVKANAVSGNWFSFTSENKEPVDNTDSSAILLENSTYRYTFTAGQEGVIEIPQGAKYLVYGRGSSDTVNPEYIEFLYNNVIVGELHNVEIPIELCAGKLSTNTGLIQEITGTSDGTTYDMFRNYAFEKLIAFNPIYERIVSTDYNGSGTIIYHCFAEHGLAYLGATTNKDAMPVGTTHIRIGLGGFSTNQTQKVIKINFNCRLKDRCYTIVKSCGKQYTPYGSYARFFSFEVTKPHIFQESEETTTDYYADGEDVNGDLQRDWTNGMIIFAKDYSNIGKPSKVIVNFHGTRTFDFGKKALTESQQPQWTFLSKCGYTVIDCSTDTFYTNRAFSSGVVARASNFPTGNAWECYSELFKFVIDNFNVDPNAFYFLGKSAGGMNLVSFANKFSNIKVNAVGLLAPGIDVWCNMRILYSSGTNDFLEKIGCDNPNVSLGNSSGVGSASTADKNYVLGYKDLINLFNPFMVLTSESFDKDFWVNEILDKGMFTARYTGDTSPLDNNTELNAMIAASKVYFKSPLKIWHAVDDNAVPFTESKWFVQMCKNAGCYALIRQWPANQGKHYFDSFVEGDDGTGTTYDPPMVNYVTKFGETISANPVYCELIDWFNRW